MPSAKPAENAPDTDSLGMPLPQDIPGGGGIVVPEPETTQDAPADPPKRKRGRPPGSGKKPKNVITAAPAAPAVSAAPSADQQKEMVTKAFAGALMGAFAIIASKAGEHWRANEEECRAIAEPLAEIFPDGFADPYIRLAAASAMVIGPKYVEHTKIRSAQLAKRRASAPSGPEGKN